MVERLSTYDESFFSSYADHILRYQFAANYCVGTSVLDAGCGIGYGSAYLATHGADRVLAIDLSESALAEARQLFRAPNLSFVRRDVETIAEMQERFGVIVNFENLEHLSRPEDLVYGASRLLTPEGKFVTSTPNGSLSTYGADGKLLNEFHVREYTLEEFCSLLKPHFRSIEMYGQWITPVGRLRKIRAKQAFDYLAESYFNPFSLLWRYARSMMGRKSMSPPEYFGEADSFDGDYEIHLLNQPPFPWQPTVLLAVCSN